MIEKLFWVALTIVFTFCFIVLFEHGPSDYATNAQQEFQEFRTILFESPKKAPDRSDKLE